MSHDANRKLDKKRRISAKQTRNTRFLLTRPALLPAGSAGCGRKSADCSPLACLRQALGRKLSKETCVCGRSCCNAFRQLAYMSAAVPGRPASPVERREAPRKGRTETREKTSGKTVWNLTCDHSACFLPRLCTAFALPGNSLVPIGQTGGSKSGLRSEPNAGMGPGVSSARKIFSWDDFQRETGRKAPDAEVPWCRVLGAAEAPNVSLSALHSPFVN